MTSDPSMMPMTDPRECEHVFAYDEAQHIVYCPRCMWWWHCEYESPTRGARPQCPNGAASEAKRHQSAELTHATKCSEIILNPDNEPTSEHNQWRDTDDWL